MAHQLEPSSKRMKQEQDKPEESAVNLNELPELPFELILSYLSLEDRIKARAVSRRWYKMINSFKVEKLCYSTSPIGCIIEKNHWVDVAFAQNFINSTKLSSFFQTFGRSILFNLKHFRLCQLSLDTENTPESFVQILSSFGQLEELDLFNIIFSSKLGKDRFQLRLNLPTLKSIKLVWVIASNGLTLDAPRLQNIQLMGGLKVELVNGESVEKLIIGDLNNMEVSKLKNLKYLWCGKSRGLGTDSTLLSTLEQLKEIHLTFGIRHQVLNLFEQKQRYGRSNLKIFFCGCLLDDPSDPAIDSLGYDNEKHLVSLIENKSRLAEEIPFIYDLQYSTVEAVAPGLEIDFLKRFTGLKRIDVIKPIQNIDRFLYLLKNSNNITELGFEGDQPQELFDRLPDHCAIQFLRITNAPENLDFVFKLKNLLALDCLFPFHIEFVQPVLESLPFLCKFSFAKAKRKRYSIAIDYFDNIFTIRINYSKHFTVHLPGERQIVSPCFSDVNAVVQWISEKAPEVI